MTDLSLGWWGVPVALFGGAIRASTPFLFVSLGECITEKSGRINLGLEGTLVLGAMSGYAVSYLSGSPWLGVLAAACVGALFGVLHAAICSLPRVNDIAVGIALMLLGIGLAFFLGKPFIKPAAPNLPSIDLGWWSSVPQIHDALKVNILFILGVVLAPAILWGFRNTRWGLVLRMVGDSADAARAMGYSVNVVRLLATALGGVSRRHRRLVPVALLPRQLERAAVQRPGDHRRGAGDLRALEPDAVLLCVAAVRRGGRASGQRCRSVGVSSGYYLFNATPYALTLLIMIVTCSPKRALIGAPNELAVIK